MRWLEKEIEELKTYRSVSDPDITLVDRDDVIALLSRRCKDCKYHVVEERVSRLGNGKTIRHGECIRGDKPLYRSGSSLVCKNYVAREKE